MTNKIPKSNHIERSGRRETKDLCIQTKGGSQDQNKSRKEKPKGKENYTIEEGFKIPKHKRVNK